MRQGFKQKNIVIIGAGFSGILCAQRLEKKTARLKNISITLIDKNPYFTMRTEIHAAATGRGKPEGITLGEMQRCAKNVLRCAMELNEL